MCPSLCLEAYQTVFLIELAMLYAIGVSKMSLLFARQLTNGSDWEASESAEASHAHVICLLQLVPLNFNVESLCSLLCRMTM